jgi:hypothetical protein
MGVQWNKGTPPAMPDDKRLLLIGTPRNGHFGGGQPEIFVGRYRAAEKQFYPLRIWGMSGGDPLHPLNVMHWAELEIPESVELRLPDLL